MNLGAAEVATILSIGSMCGSMLFFGTLQLGRLIARMEKVEDRVMEHTDDIKELDRRMDKAGKEMSDLTDKIQVIPEQVVKDLLRSGRGVTP